MMRDLGNSGQPPNAFTPHRIDDDVAVAGQLHPHFRLRFSGGLGTNRNLSQFAREKYGIDIGLTLMNNPHDDGLCFIDCVGHGKDSIVTEKPLNEFGAGLFITRPLLWL